MGSVSLIITTNRDTAQFVKNKQEKNVLRRAGNFLRGLDAGAIIGNVQISASPTNAVAASGTITLSTVVATNTVTIGNIVFTFTATPSVSTATAQDVLVTGGDTVAAAAFVAAIAANATAKQFLYATSALGVITVSSRVPGIIGNYISLAKSGAPITVSGSGYFTGGTGGSGSLGAPLTVGR